MVSVSTFLQFLLVFVALIWAANECDLPLAKATHICDTCDHSHLSNICGFKRD